MKRYSKLQTCPLVILYSISANSPSKQQGGRHIVIGAMGSVDRVITLGGGGGGGRKPETGVIYIYIYILPGTPNNHVLMDVCLNNCFQFIDLESSNWNNHKELVVWSSRYIWLHTIWICTCHILYMITIHSRHVVGHVFCSNPEKWRANLRNPRATVGAERSVWSWKIVVNLNQLIANMNLEVVFNHGNPSYPPKATPPRNKALLRAY